MKTRKDMKIILKQIIMERGYLNPMETITGKKKFKS